MKWILWIMLSAPFVLSAQRTKIEPERSSVPEQTEVADCSIEVPNALTFGEGSSDLLIVKTECVLEDFKFKIFNRWGSMVFKTADINEGWDGSTKKAEAKEGTYFWMVSYKENSEEVNLTGYTTVIVK